MARETRTPQARALEAHAVLERKAEKAKAVLDRAEAAVPPARAAHEEAVRRLTYSGQNPDLPDEVRGKYVELDEPEVTEDPVELDDEG